MAGSDPRDVPWSHGHTVRGMRPSPVAPGDPDPRPRARRGADRSDRHRVRVPVRHDAVDMFLSWSPGMPKRLGSQTIAALMDDRLREAIGFTKPPRANERGVEGALGARSRALRRFPPRRTPKLRTELRHRTYPHGHLIEALGPPPPDSARVEVGAEWRAGVPAVVTAERSRALERRRQGRAARETDADRLELGRRIGQDHPRVGRKLSRHSQPQPIRGVT